MTKWCWVEICECRTSADENILTRAVTTYYKTDYEYGLIGMGIDWDLDGLKEINCWQLVAYTLEQLGYNASDRGHPKSEPSSVMYDKYFCSVANISEARPGDIVQFDSKPGSSAPEHVAILASVPEQKDSVWTGWIFHAANWSLGITFTTWTSNQLFDPAYTQYISGIYRPKVCRWGAEDCDVPGRPMNSPKARPLDPLTLDLDGGGIQTAGLSADIHFDHDSNGFKELTSWVAPGDGMLVLDKNGNGRLDDGSELLGDFTILPNGMRAANGFAALAQYDSNADLKIDAHDPIWSQLRVWEHDTYILPQGGG